MFCDLVDLTGIAAKLDAEEWLKALAEERDRKQTAEFMLNVRKDEIGLNYVCEKHVATNKKVSGLRVDAVQRSAPRRFVALHGAALGER
jgi:hypothetical protein